MELYIIDECHNHSFSQCQYGFIGDRGTAMASVMAHDVSQECVSKGSTVLCVAWMYRGHLTKSPILYSSTRQWVSSQICLGESYVTGTVIW